MTLRGKVKNSKVLLDNPIALPEGTLVEVRPVTPVGGRENFNNVTVPSAAASISSSPQSSHVLSQ